MTTLRMRGDLHIDDDEIINLRHHTLTLTSNYRC